MNFLVRNLLNHFLIAIVVLFVRTAIAQAPPIDSSPDPSAAGSLIEDDNDDVYRLDAKNFKIGDQVLFIRTSKGEFEILARGAVEGMQDGKALVSVDRSTIVKLPLKGDLAIPIAKPWTPEPAEPDRPPEPVALLEEDPLPDEPGHMQFDYGFVSGSLQTDSPNQANAYKNIGSYRFPYWRYTWMFEFAWRFGFDIESYGGKVPTFSYIRREEQTEQSIFRFNFNYRLRPYLDGWLRPTFRFVSLLNDFTTTNKDEAILSSSYSAMGAGVRLASEFKSNVWSPKKGDWPFTLQQVYLDLDYFPSVSAKDELVSRGTAIGSSAYGWKVGATAFVYIKQMPFLKRFVIEGSYGQTIYDLKFSGETTSEAGGPYKIPEGARYVETTSYYMISIGIRIEDTLGKFFMPR